MSFFYQFYFKIFKSQTMKIYIGILTVFLSFATFAQKTKVDTAQLISPNRTNAAETLKKPYVILISSDGFRYDYMEKYQAKNLQDLANKGVWSKRGMYPSYPSITFPNHYTIATGLYPAHHGLVDNVFYDPNREEMYIIGSETIKDGSWSKGLPIWGLAENQGMLSASLFWVGSESNAGGTRPSFWYAYHEQFSDDDKVNIVKNWLTLPEEERPHFITLYFPEVDHMGHRHGPDSKETEASVQYVDNAIKKLVDELAPLNLPINYIFVSDHGMIEVEEKDYISMPEIDKEKFKVVNSNTFARVTAKEQDDILPLYKKLKSAKSADYKVYLADKFPRKYHYSSREDDSRRVGDIILTPKKAKILVSSERKPSPGKHGFSHCKVPEMKATFVAWGPAFKEGKIIRPFENIHIYPLIAEILELEIKQPIDGKRKVLKKTLK